MRRHLQLFICVTLALVMGVATQAFGQGEKETRSGCLVNGKKAGTFELVDEVTGSSVQITGKDLGHLTEGGGARVNATGTISGTGATAVFQADTVEQTRAVCSPVAFSLENQKNQIGKLRAGVRAGFSLDPELVLIGGQVQLGPVLKGVWFRPTVEFGLGEVTKVLSGNGDIIFYLPVSASSARSRWNIYAGGGPAITVLRRDFGGFPNQQPVDVDDDWDSEFGVNFVVGAIHSNGMFAELRAAAYNTPTIRFYVGFVFH